MTCHDFIHEIHIYALVVQSFLRKIVNNMPKTYYLETVLGTLVSLVCIISVCECTHIYIIDN